MAMKNGVWIQIGPVQISTGGPLNFLISFSQSEIEIPNLIPSIKESPLPEVILEPITNEITSTSPVRFYNPSGIVKNDFALFKVEVDPDFPDQNITWSQVDGSEQK